MDEATKRELQEAAKRTPRFLFRAWTNAPPPSGGLTGLNTTEAIIPRAFFLGKCKKDKTIHDLTRTDFARMCLGHLQGSWSITTELSSWASSLQTAFHFVRNASAREYYISIIDTGDIKSPICHVPALKAITGTSSYDHEYLAHGIISGAAHKAVSLREMMNIGFPKHYGWQTHMPLRTSGQWALIRNDLTADECESARSVAVQYGAKFGAAVMVAILCLKQRDGCLWRNGTDGVEHQLNNYLKDFDIPADLCADQSILTDIVYTNGYGNVEQMIRMLRALLNLRHGKGARVKRPTEKVRAR